MILSRVVMDTFQGTEVLRVSLGREEGIERRNELERAHFSPGSSSLYTQVLHFFHSQTHCIRILFSLPPSLSLSPNSQPIPTTWFLFPVSSLFFCRSRTVHIALFAVRTCFPSSILHSFLLPFLDTPSSSSSTTLPCAQRVQQTAHKKEKKKKRGRTSRKIQEHQLESVLD